MKCAIKSASHKEYKECAQISRQIKIIVRQLPKSRNRAKNLCHNSAAWTAHPLSEVLLHKRPSLLRGLHKRPTLLRGTTHKRPSLLRGTTQTPDPSQRYNTNARPLSEVLHKRSSPLRGTTQTLVPSQRYSVYKRSSNHLVQRYFLSFQKCIGLVHVHRKYLIYKTLSEFDTILKKCRT